MNVSEQIVYLVEDDCASLESLALMLTSRGFEVVCFSSATEALDAMDANLVSCLVADIRMPNIDGLALQRLMLERDMGIPIVFVSGHADVRTATTALKSGALDLLEKPIDSGLLCRLITEAFELSASRLRTKAKRTRVESLLASLTDRERDVLPLIYVGKSLKQIALHFDVTVPTASRHQSRVFEKLGIESAAQLIRMFDSAELDIARVE
jgi:FixJ family two-component response regulator